MPASPSSLGQPPPHRGTLTLETIESSRIVVIDASGRYKRGQGPPGNDPEASASSALRAAWKGATDFTITGRLARLSRGPGFSANYGFDGTLARLAAPLGLDLGAVSSDETALSILAEVVAARHGRDGGRLAHARGRIHEVAA